MEIHERFVLVQQRRRPAMRRGELVEIIEELVEIVEHLLHHHHHPDQRRAIVQVVISDAQKVLLHAAEENAAGNPIDVETGTAVWTSDRQDVGVLDPQGFDCEFTSIGPDGDTIVTVTITEPDTTDDSGSTVPGAVYVGTQVVTVNADQTIVSVEITAGAPEPR